MANEIDLYKDLEYVEKFIKAAEKNKDNLMLREWLKEKERIAQKIKKQYPDLSL